MEDFWFGTAGIIDIRGFIVWHAGKCNFSALDEWASVAVTWYHYWGYDTPKGVPCHCISHNMSSVYWYDLSVIRILKPGTSHQTGFGIVLPLCLLKWALVVETDCARFPFQINLNSFYCLSRIFLLVSYSDLHKVQFSSLFRSVNALRFTSFIAFTFILYYVSSSTVDSIVQVGEKRWYIYFYDLFQEISCQVSNALTS